MSDSLTFEEMKQRYHDEWLLIAYTEIDENLNIIRGEVLAHSPEAEELYKLLPTIKDRAVAFEYIGEIPTESGSDGMISRIYPVQRSGNLFILNKQ